MWVGVKPCRRAQDCDYKTEQTIKLFITDALQHGMSSFGPLGFFFSINVIHSGELKAYVGDQ